VSGDLLRAGIESFQGAEVKLCLEDDFDGGS
jgi:hypothetical protein